MCFCSLNALLKCACLGVAEPASLRAHVWACPPARALGARLGQRSRAPRPTPPPPPLTDAGTTSMLLTGRSSTKSKVRPRPCVAARVWRATRWTSGVCVAGFEAATPSPLPPPGLPHPPGEHRDSPETYTAIYDAVVTSIRKFAPTGSANMKFMGLALESDRDFPYERCAVQAASTCAVCSVCVCRCPPLSCALPYLCHCFPVLAFRLRRVRLCPSMLHCL
jgi:hypothetical protein